MMKTTGKAHPNSYPMTREEIVDKIRKVEALYAGSSSAGETSAAAEALDRLKNRLATAPEEFKDLRKAK